MWDNRFVNLLLESMADGVFTLDIRGRISSWNQALERISGYRAEEVMGKPCGILGFSQCFGRQCPADPTECGLFENEGTETKECLLRHKNGHEVPVLKKARVVKDEQGRILGAIETVTDFSELQKARYQAQEANRRLAERHRLGKIIGKSHAMQKVFEAIQAAAASDASVLIQGESGTGKELVAGAIHYRSSRKDHPFVAVNCSALSESLLESELFGHVKGAFTGANRDRIGRFEAAQAGSLFLDEIGEISPYIQVKLLRVLQERRIERVGESRPRPVDIRILAATHQDLYQMVRQGRFRDDLFYRLKVFPIHLPPLRQRKEDIPLLISHFVRQQNKKTGKPIHGLSPSAMQLCMDYPWPGNIRELQNAVEHAFVLCTEASIDVFDLPVEIRQSPYPSACEPGEAALSPVPPSDSNPPLNREGLVRLLHECDWNKAEAARRLGKSRTSVWKYMKKWGIPLKKP